jgi:geranylgeranyl pyrophosphate synthase
MSEINRLKTGALIRASCQLGGLTAELTTEEQLLALDRYGSAIGLAFQIVDDILDVTADSDTLGKTGGADQRMDKSTYVSMLGIDKAREECDKLHHQALESIRLLGDNSALFSQLAQFVVNRSY